MEEELKNIVLGIETKVNRLIQENKEKDELIQNLEETNEQLLQEINQKDTELEELKLKVQEGGFIREADSIQGVKDIKNKINSIVQDIDSCIRKIETN